MYAQNTRLLSFASNTGYKKFPGEIFGKTFRVEYNAYNETPTKGHTMFNRSVKLSLTKDKKQKDEQAVTTPTDHVAIATEIGKKVLIGTVIVLAAYISLDTARQVTVNNVIPK